MICILIGKANPNNKSDNKPVIYETDKPAPCSLAATPGKTRTDNYLRLDGKEDSSSRYKSTEVSTNGTPKKVATIKQLTKEADERGENFITEIDFEVKGLSYRGTDALIEAESLVKGDILSFQPEPDNPHDRNAIKVCTARGIFIGYVPRTCAQEFSSRKNDFIDCYVRRVKKGYDTAYIKATARYYGEFFIYDEDFDTECTVHKLHDYLAPAMKLKKDGEIEKAAAAYLVAGEKESSVKDKISAYHQACVCLRKLKKYQDELGVVNKILKEFKADLSDKQKENYQKRQETVTRFITNV